MKRRRFLSAAIGTLATRGLAGEKQPPQIPSVTLRGSPVEIGSLWGRMNAKAIHSDMEQYYLKPAKDAGISTATLLARSEKYAELSRRHAPHWLEETRAVAEAAGVASELYLAFTGGVYRSLFTGHECTSYAMSTAHTVDGRIFFHKNRDNALKKQAVFILDGSASGVNKFIAVSDASVVACMMMVNDKGLAGSADTGGLKVTQPAFRGMMNTAILRHIGEQAATCEDALRIVQEFVREGRYAGGSKTGTHWLFVDAAGKILEISNNSRAVTHTWHTEKTYFSARQGSRAEKALLDARAPVDFANFHNASRDSSMCIQSSIAGMSVEIDRQHPGVLSRAWVSLPAKALSFPLFIGGAETPLPLVNGEVFDTCHAIDGRREEWERIEAVAFLRQNALESEVRTLLQNHDLKRAATSIDKWTRQITAEHLSALRG
jgi:hypothetical protein